VLVECDDVGGDGHVGALVLAVEHHEEEIEA